MLLRTEAVIGVALVIASSAGASDAREPGSELAVAARLVEAFYPDVAADRDAVGWFETYRVPAADLGKAFAAGSSRSGTQWRLRVHRMRREASSGGALLEIELGFDRAGRVRSFVLAACEVFDSVGIDEVRKSLTERQADSREIERALRSRFALYPPSKDREAAAAFRRQLLAAVEVVGRIEVSDVQFGSPVGRDPADKTVDVYWVVKGTRNAESVVAIFEPIGGRLVSLHFLD